MIYTFREFAEQMLKPGQSIMDLRLYEYLKERPKAVKHYKTVLIEKKSGGKRVLHVPDRGLKRAQYQVLRYLKDAEVSPCAFAYREGRSLSDHALCHVKAPLLVKLDIANFFGSVRFPQVFNAIDIALAQSPLAGPGKERWGYFPYNGKYPYNGELAWCFARICTLLSFLPQGAPTSPMLSNLVFLPLDNGIQSYCEKRRIRYTRYSDDMIFSGDFQPEGLIKFIRRRLMESDFRLNENKIVIAGQGRQQKVTGVVVNERPQADRKYRRRIRQDLYYIGKFGLEGHLEAKGLLWEGAGVERRLVVAVNELQKLIGRINFVLQIDSGNEEFWSYKEECIFLLNLLPSLFCGQPDEKDPIDNRPASVIGVLRSLSGD